MKDIFCYANVQLYFKIQRFSFVRSCRILLVPPSVSDVGVENLVRNLIIEGLIELIIGRKLQIFLIASRLISSVTDMSL